MTYALPFTPYLTTLNRVKLHQEINTVSSSDDGLIVQIIAAVSTAAQQYLRRVCVPYLATHQFERSYSAYSLFLTEHDLLELSAATNFDGTSIPINQIYLRPINSAVKNRVLLDNSQTSFVSRTSNIQTISLTGMWGYVPHYAYCWITSGVNVPAGNISSSATSFTLSAGQGAVFDTLTYLRIDSETLLITGIAADTLTVERAQLGTTAAAHTAGTSMRKYRQTFDLEKAAIDWCVFLYRNRAAYENAIQLIDTQIILNRAPSHIFAILDTHVRHSYQIDAL